MKISPWPQAKKLLNDIFFVLFISIDNTTNSRTDQLQLRDSSRLVVLAACKSEDLSLSEKGAALTCPFVLIVFANAKYHYLFLLFSYPGREERIHKKVY